MFFWRIALLFVVVAVSGCNNEKNRDLIDLRTEQAVLMGEEARDPGPPKSYDPLTVSEKVWVGNAAVKLRGGRPLPDRLEGYRGVTLITSSPMGLVEMAAILSQQTGVPVRLATDIASGAPTGTMGGGGGLALALSYEGSLSGLLDKICGTFGLNWSYDGATVTLSRYVTNVFAIKALPGEISVTDGIGEDSSGGGGGDSSSSSAGGSYNAGSSSALRQSSEMTAQLHVWDDINATVRAIIGASGAVVVSPSSGTITVTTTPELMRTVAAYVDEENQRLSHQIAINVEVYSVSVQDDHNFDVSLSTAFARMGAANAFGLNIGGAAGTMLQDVSSTAGNLSLAILNPDGRERIGTVFQALSSVGDATRVAQFPMTTLNNKTVSRRIGRDRTYVASITNETSTTSSTSSSTVTPSTIREGFSLQLTPRLLEDGRIMLQYSLSLIDIVQITSFDTGAGKIELPETSSRVFVQQTMLKSGSTLVIGGYDDEKTIQSSQGVGSPYNYFFGGGSTNSKTRSMLFIAITPQVLDVGPVERL